MEKLARVINKIAIFVLLVVIIILFYCAIILNVNNLFNNLVISIVFSWFMISVIFKGHINYFIQTEFSKKGEITKGEINGN